MFFAGNRSHAIPLFVSAYVLPLNKLYFETVCSLMHDIESSSAYVMQNFQFQINEYGVRSVTCSHC